MAEPIPQALAREIAAPRPPAWAGFHGADRVNRHVARSEGFLEAVSAGWDRGAYALFEEMEEKDPHLHSLLQTRRNGVLARPRRIDPAGASPEAREAAERTRRALEGLPGFDAALAHLLEGVAKGMAVLEIVWGYDNEGRVIPLDLKPRAPWRFSFGDGGELRLLPEPASLAGPAAGSPFRPAGEPVPPRKFIVLLHGATDERPHGRGLCERVYWLWWFKKNNLKFWVMHNEKFGSPTVVAKHPQGLAQGERDRLLEIVGGIQADAGVTVPEGVALDLLETSRGGAAETFGELARWCNAEMSRAVLGQTLTSGEGERNGSLALAKVHEAVRFDYIRADAALLMDAVNHQLVRWMTDFNEGPAAPAPRWVVDLTPDVDREAEIKIDRLLLQMGVPLPLGHFYGKYGRPAPAEGERPLRYDDQNVFQYHLQYGVMTVNEARAALGLPPVPWGDRPPAPAAATAPAKGGSPPPSGGSREPEDEELSDAGPVEDGERDAR